MDPPSVIDELRSARLRWGLSQDEVSRRIGTTQAVVARLESGQSDPRLGTIQRYAHAVHAHLDVHLPDRNQRSLARTAESMRPRIAENRAGDAFRDVIQFLDDMEPLDTGTRQRAIQDEPASTDDARWDALLAGVAEYTARQYSLTVPGWSAAPGRFLSYCWFPIESILGRPAAALAAMVFVNAVPELANRSVFVDRSSLVSV